MVSGTIDDAALASAIGSGSRARTFGAVDLAIVRADDAAAIVRVLTMLESASNSLPVWIVYIKGKAAPLGETAVRALMRQAGYVDTKTAAVSEKLTALRFVRRGGGKARRRGETSIMPDAP